MSAARPPLERRANRRATRAELTARVASLAREVRALKQRIDRLLAPARPLRTKR